MECGLLEGQKRLYLKCYIWWSMLLDAVSVCDFVSALNKESYTVATETTVDWKNDTYLNQEDIRYTLLLHICLLVELFVIPGGHLSEMKTSNGINIVSGFSNVIWSR